MSADCRALAVPIRKSTWFSGCLVVQFERPIATTAAPELSALCQAFAEVLSLRQAAQTDHFLNKSWPNFQAALSSLAKSATLTEAAYCAVNDLAQLVDADRVSLVPRAGTVKAISGVVRPDHRADAVVAIKRTGRQAILEAAPISQHVRESDNAAAQQEKPEKDIADHLARNFVCVPFASFAESARSSPDMALLLEWDDYERFAAGCTTLNYVFPAFVSAWQQTHSNLSIPRALRRIFQRTSARFSTHRIGKLVRIAGLIGILGLIAYLINLPTGVRIEATGSMQPIEQRIVFAALDGQITRLLVTDGQSVQKGDAVAEMQSPELDLKLQEVRGEIFANSEKRDGLSVAINQITSGSPDAFSLQNKLSSEIRQLETQLANLTAKQAALLKLAEHLTLRSPNDGVVVSSEIERYLDSRPVRRGDPLLRVVDLDGPWRLELLVADRDSGYVKEKLFDANTSMVGEIPESSDREIQFVITAQPSKELRAQLTWMAEAARNPNGQGMFIDLFADISQNVEEHGHMGASVSAYIECAEKPIWFVWSRPLIEAIQRKLWF